MKKREVKKREEKTEDKEETLLDSGKNNIYQGNNGEGGGGGEEEMEGWRLGGCVGGGGVEILVVSMRLAICNVVERERERTKPSKIIKMRVSHLAPHTAIERSHMPTPGRRWERNKINHCSFPPGKQATEHAKQPNKTLTKLAAKQVTSHIYKTKQPPPFPNQRKSKTKQKKQKHSHHQK